MMSTSVCTSLPGAPARGPAGTSRADPAGFCAACFHFHARPSNVSRVTARRYSGLGSVLVNFKSVVSVLAVSQPPSCTVGLSRETLPPPPPDPLPPSPPDPLNRLLPAHGMRTGTMMASPIAAAPMRRPTTPSGSGGVYVSGSLLLLRPPPQRASPAG